MRYAIFACHYASYEDIAAYGDKPQKQVTGAMSFKEAWDKLLDYADVEDWRHFIKPVEPTWPSNTQPSSRST